MLSFYSLSTMIYLCGNRALIWWWRDGDTYKYTISVFGWVFGDKGIKSVFLTESKANTDHWSCRWSPTLIHQSHATEGYLGSECIIIWLWPHLRASLLLGSEDQSRLEFFIPPQAVLNPHQAINPPPGHSTSLSLYFSSFLHGEAWLIWLSMLEDRKVDG